MAEYFRELRRKVGKQKILVPGTGAIVLNERGEVLLMLRADDGTWGLPGGFMDLGETVCESLRRELREELGLESRDEELFAIYSGPEFETKHENGEETAGITNLFVVRHYDGTPRNSEESRELRFVKPTDLPEPMNGSSLRFIRDFLERGDATGPMVL
jgi:ADP-ribose pyrophosphatase YjhB (NUDIX family)